MINPRISTDMLERLNRLKFPKLIFSCFVWKAGFLIVPSAPPQVSSSPTCKLVIFLTWCLAEKLKIKAITILLLLQKEHHLVPASERMFSFPVTRKSLSRAKINSKVFQSSQMASRIKAQGSGNPTPAMINGCSRNTPQNHLDVFNVSSYTLREIPDLRMVNKGWSN